MNKFYFITIIAALLITSCRSASKSYEKGNYRDAIDIAIKRLQKDPNDAETKSLLQKAYVYAVDRHEDQIRILTTSNSVNKYDQIYSQYDQLQDLYNKIRSYPSVANFIKPTDYSSYVQTYKDKAADAHAERGMKWLDATDNSKRTYREAYQEFKLALRYRPQDIELKKLLEEAYEGSLVKVLIVPVDAVNNNFYYSNSSYRIRNFQDALIRNLNYNSNHNFVRYYTEWDARSQNLKPDEIVEMQFGRMNFGKTFDQHSTKKLSKEVVVKETVYKKDSVVKEYAKVTAELTITRRTLVSDADMFVTSRDPRGRIIWSDNFRGEHKWTTEFATYKGDERALDEEDKKLLNKKEARPPREEEIVNEVIQQLESNLTYRLRNYYNRFQ